MVEALSPVDDHGIPARFLVSRRASSSSGTAAVGLVGLAVDLVLPAPSRMDRREI